MYESEDLLKCVFSMLHGKANVAEKRLRQWLSCRSFSFFQKGKEVYTL